MNCEDVEVGFSLKADMSDAEIFHGGHGSKLHNLLDLICISKCLCHLLHFTMHAACQIFKHLIKNKTNWLLNYLVLCHLEKMC